MKFPGLERLEITRNYLFYFPALENWTTGLFILELINMQVNAQVPVKSRNALIGALQDLELHLLSNQISL